MQRIGRRRQVFKVANRHKSWRCRGQNLKSLVQTDSSPTLSATGEPAQTTTGMRIAKVKQRRRPEFVRIARLVGMHGSISPKKVEIAGHDRNVLQLKQPQPERVAE